MRFKNLFLSLLTIVLVKMPDGEILYKQEKCTKEVYGKVEVYTCEEKPGISFTYPSNYVLTDTKTGE